jgi:hypothetical protein
VCFILLCDEGKTDTQVSPLFLPLNCRTDSAGEYHRFQCFSVLLCNGRFFTFGLVRIMLYVNYAGLHLKQSICFHLRI